MTASGPRTRWLERAAAAATLLLPAFLLHGRGLAEAMMLVVGAAFLLRSGLERDWRWLRRFWVRIGLLWWGWLVLCSAAVAARGGGWEPVGQAAGVVRFLLLVAALEGWVLRGARVRVWLERLLRWSAVYIAAQSLLQFATGRNLFGFPRGMDGELTGPYRNPRAGAPLSRLLFPAVLPVLDWWAARGRALAGLGVLLGGVGVMVLIGQRMPLLLTLLGLFTTALLLPRLRSFVLAGCLVAGALLAVTPVVSPPTFTRLVTKFSSQMEHLPTSHYGQIAARAVNIAEAHPLLGAGFDGFRRLCEEPRYFGGWDGTDGGGAAMCVQHPHNFYLQALVEGGVPGLGLFCLLALSWLRPLARGLWRSPDARRVGLFVAALIQLWPVASTTAFTSMPLSGWFFVLLGLGLATARPHITVPNEERTSHV